MTVRLGYEPAGIEVTLVRNAPFVMSGLIRENNLEWPNPPSLRFSDAGGTWLAALSPDNLVATFSATAADVNDALQSETAAIYDATTGYVYGTGPVRVVNGVPT